MPAAADRLHALSTSRPSGRLHTHTPPAPTHRLHTHTACTHTPPAAAHDPVRAWSTQEWILWFTATAGTLNADEFNVIMEEMQSSAEEMVTLVRCTRLAAEGAAEEVGRAADSST